MRRGKLNKTAYILLIISAIFTILSYVSDQLVIGYENKLREKKSSYQTLDTEIKSLESTDLILDSFSSLKRLGLFLNFLASILFLTWICQIVKSDCFFYIMCFDFFFCDR